MSNSSVSFRISRHTQDLAETVHALSQRLVTLEQRLGALELQLQAVRQQPREDQEAEAASLAPIEAHIDRLLQDCRQLLAEQPVALAEAGLAAEADGVEAGDRTSEQADAAPTDQREEDPGDGDFALAEAA